MKIHDRAVQHARDLLLDAAVDAPQWRKALEAVADACSARTGQLISLGPQRKITLNILTGVPESIAQLAESCGLGDPSRNPRLRAGLKMPLMTPVVDEDYIDKQSRKRSEIYGEFFDPQDFWFNCQAAVLQRDDMLVRLSITRTKREGPADGESLKAFHELLPFVRAAARLQVALSETRIAGMMQAFDSSATTAVLLDAHGLLSGASCSGEKLLQEGRYMTMHNGRVEAAAYADWVAFEKRVAGALANDGASRSVAGDTLVLRSRDGISRVSVEFHILPRERNVFDCRAVLLLLIKPVDDDRQRMEALRKAFALTETEAAVAMLMVAGHSHSGIAAQRGVSVTTIRTQVQAIYSKLDVHRQAELSQVIERLAAKRKS